MKRKHKLYPTGCIYNILGSNPNSYIPMAKPTRNRPNVNNKPMTRVRTKTSNGRRGRK